MRPKKHQNLAEKLIETIRADGPLSLEQYMCACLMDAEFGYYNGAEVFGEDGDFITAPEISQVFGELLGLWAASVWQNMGAPKSFNLVELGPGRGTLMADALRALKILPGALSACDVHLIEKSTRLRQLQNEKLSPLHKRLNWHADSSTVPNAPTIILANEFLDALAIRQFIKSDGHWFERLVGLGSNDEFEYVLAERHTEPDIRSDILNDANNGDIIETRELPQQLLPRLLPGPEKAPGHPIAALFIDYGHSRSATGDSFQAIKDHAYADPLENPGQADVTAHVDFEAFARIMGGRNYVVYEPISQNEFLGSLGIIERGERLMKNASMTARNKIENQIARLISPDAMGVRFKVLGLASPHCPPLPGLYSQSVSDE